MPGTILKVLLLLLVGAGMARAQGEAADAGEPSKPPAKAPTARTVTPSASATPAPAAASEPSTPTSRRPTQVTPSANTATPPALSAPAQSAPTTSVKRPRTPTESAPTATAARPPLLAQGSLDAGSTKPLPLPTAPVQTLRARLGRLTAANPKLADSVLTSIEHLIDVAERIAKTFPTQAVGWRARAERHLAAAERGADLYPELRGQIVSRGYRSPISTRVQGYTVYVPPDYTPDKRWPLMIVLHGGSSNGNLFLGVVLGNNMDWKSYDKHLWDEYTPRWSPPFIVAAPDGYGQVLWRWMGEQDVLDVIADIERNYSVDSDRIVLSGLSNGGVGAYAIGSRHAYRFSVVQAIAGAPSWIQYAGAGSVASIEAKLMRPWSALDLHENWRNTDFRYFHGNVDPGPMKPAFVRELDQRLAAEGTPHTGKWFEAGHDLLYLVHRHGKVYGELLDERRAKTPSEVHLVTGDYRAARQHWLELTRFTRYPELARLVGKSGADRVEITSENASAFVVHVQDLPSGADKLALYVDGTRVYEGARASLGARLELVKRGSSWERGAPPEAGLTKRKGSSGPMTDAYYERTVHVYGTQRPENSAALKRIAERASRGLPLWLWSVEQEVIPDSMVTPALAKSAHLVLYGTPGDNAVLDRIAAKLPIGVVDQSVRIGDKRVSERGVGARFIYPNPEATERYVIVQTAPTVDGVQRGLNLPDFVPDYVVYDASSAAARARLVPGRKAPLRGFFDANWQLEAP